MRVKVFGERNSGTNFVISILERNLPVPVPSGVAPRWYHRLSRRREGVIDAYFRVTQARNLGWKHRSVRPLLQARPGPDWLIVAVTKNPYAWVLSMHRRPYHRRERAESLEAFVTTPWRTVGRETAPRVYPDPVAMWNDKVDAYLQVVERCGGVLLRYEDLLRDAQGEVARVAEAAGVPVRDDFQGVAASTKGDAKGFDDYRAYYLEERWRAELPDAVAALVDARIDRDLLGRLGYDRPD